MSSPAPWTAYEAGVVGFLAPCTLVLVPFFLLYLAGAALLLRREGAGARPLLVALGLLFGLGFVPGFVVVWSFPNAIEVVVRLSRVLERFGGAVLILYGLGVAGLLFALRRRLRLIRPLSPKRALGARWASATPKPLLLLALLIGATFAVGWTPCVGRTLSQILGLTGGPQGPIASLLLVLYGLGLMTPFVLLAGAAVWPARLLGRQGVSRWAAPVVGTGLVAVGLVVLTGNLRDLTAYLFALAPGFLL